MTYIDYIPFHKHIIFPLRDLKISNNSFSNSASLIIFQRDVAGIECRLKCIDPIRQKNTEYE